MLIVKFNNKDYIINNAAAENFIKENLQSNIFNIYKYTVERNVYLKASLDSILQNSSLLLTEKSILLLILILQYADNIDMKLYAPINSDLQYLVINSEDAYNVVQENYDLNSDKYNLTLEYNDYSVYKNNIDEYILEQNNYNYNNLFYATLNAKFNIADKNYDKYINKFIKIEFNNDVLYLKINKNYEYIINLLNDINSFFPDNTFNFISPIVYFYKYKYLTYSLNQTYYPFVDSKYLNYINSKIFDNLNKDYIYTFMDDEFNLYLFDFDSTNSSYTKESLEKFYVFNVDNKNKKATSYYASKTFTSSNNNIFTLKIDINSIIPVDQDSTILNDTTSIFFANVVNYVGDKLDFIEVYSHIYNLTNSYKYSDKKYYSISGDFIYKFKNKHNLNNIVNLLNNKNLDLLSANLSLSKISNTTKKVYEIDGDLVNYGKKYIDIISNYLKEYKYNKYFKYTSFEKSTYKLDDVLEYLNSNFTKAVPVDSTLTTIYDYDATILTFDSIPEILIFEIDLNKYNLYRALFIPILINGVLDINNIFNLLLTNNKRNSIYEYINTDLHHFSILKEQKLYIYYNALTYEYYLITKNEPTNLKNYSILYPITIKNKIVINDFISNIYKSTLSNFENLYTELKYKIQNISNYSDNLYIDKYNGPNIF